MTKGDLRRQLLQQRRGIPPLQHHEASLMLREQLWRQVLRKLPRQALVASYVPIAAEPGLTPLWLAGAGCHLALPAVDEGRLHFRHWQPGDPLQPDTCGVRGPLASAPVVTAAAVDLLLIPAVAMHPEGFRLGYGGGWYDRLYNNTAWSRIPSLGVCFARFTDIAFRADLWDQRLHGSLSENRVNWWQPPPWIQSG